MKSLFKRNGKSKLWTKILLAILVLLSPQIAFGAGIDGVVADFIGKAIYAGILVPLFEVLKIELWLLPKIAQYNNFIREEGVIIGWTAMRNLSNMFFIIILLIIAFSTILKIQGFGYRQLLKKFIIVAILINFSRTIVGVLIDFSQVIMLTFVNVIKDISTGSLTVALGIPNLLQSTGGNWNLVAMYALAAIMLVIIVVVVLSIIAILVMRIVTLWVLVVLSPLAFISYTFPKTERYFNQWSEELGKNLFAGPAMAFFLWLAFVIVGDGKINNSFKAPGETNIAYDPAIDNASVSEAATPDRMINFVVGIAILLAGIKMTQSTGVFGAALAGTAIAAAKGYTTRMGKRAAAGTAKKAWGVTPSWAKGAAVGFAGGGVGGAVAGALLSSRRTWKGRSGEGGVKGAASRVFRGGIGSAAAQRGPGFVKRWGQRLEAAEIGRRQRKTEFYDKEAEGVRDKEAYAATMGNRKEGIAISAKEKLASGSSFTSAEATKAAEAFKHMGDTESLRKLQSRVATANDEESVQANVDKNGLEDTFGKMSFAGAVDPSGNLNGNAEAAIRVFLRQDSKAQQAAVDRMSSKDKDSFMEALAKYNPATDARLDKTKGEHEVLDATGNLRKDSVATNRMMVLSNNSAEHGAAAMNAATTAERDAVAEKRVKDINIVSLLKMQAETSPGTADPAFAALAKNLNAEQTRQFLSRSTDDAQKKTLIKVQMEAGKNLGVLTKETEAKAYVNDTNIQQSFKMQVVGPGPAPASLTAPQEAKRAELAKANLPYAKQAFSIVGGVLDKTAFANFIVSKLSAAQAAEIGPEALDEIKAELTAAAAAAGAKGATMINNLRDQHGIDLT